MAPSVPRGGYGQNQFDANAPVERPDQQWLDLVAERMVK